MVMMMMVTTLHVCLLLEIDLIHSVAYILGFCQFLYGQLDSLLKKPTCLGMTRLQSGEPKMFREGLWLNGEASALRAKGLRFDPQLLQVRPSEIRKNYCQSF